jgi:(p)ppGpp synthase/HD superfamily hydrolase
MKNGLSDKFDEALAFASELHRQQTRKGTPTPYLGHLLSVAGLVLENGGTEAQAIAALLHDAIEDQAASRGGAKALGAVIEQRFGTDVRAIVEACTDSWVDPKPPWRQRKEQYIAHVKDMPKAAALVSLADKLHNARAICADLRQHGAAVFDRFTGKRDGTLWYYESLAEQFARHHPLPIVAEFRRAVAEMKELA